VGQDVDVAQFGAGKAGGAAQDGLQPCLRLGHGIDGKDALGGDAREARDPLGEPAANAIAHDGEPHTVAVAGGDGGGDEHGAARAALKAGGIAANGEDVAGFGEGERLRDGAQRLRGGHPPGERYQELVGFGIDADRVHRRSLPVPGQCRQRG
jgi:hypothetical protein